MTRTLKAGSEAAFQIQVENLAVYYSWAVFHAPDNRPIRAKSGREYVQNVKAGFPDLVLSRGPELIVAELKTETGRLSRDQEAWLDRFRIFAKAHSDVVAQLLKARGVASVEAVPVFEVHVWRPSMLQAITDRLSRPEAGPLIAELGVCPHCEGDAVQALIGDRYRCGDCGTTWSGVRRRLAA